MTKTHRLRSTCAVACLIAVTAGCQKKKKKKEAPSPAAGARPSPAAKPFDKNQWGGRACVYKPCHERFQSFGQISGRIEVQVDSSGKATSATYRGRAPEPVKACIVEAARKIQVPGFFGEPGVLYCEYGGQLMRGGMEMMSTSWGFRPAVAAFAATTRPHWFPADFPLPAGGRLESEEKPRPDSPFYSGAFRYARPFAELVANVRKEGAAAGWRLASEKPLDGGGLRFEWLKDAPTRRRLLQRLRPRPDGATMLVVPPAVDGK
jgi:hypothetical protein